MSDKTKSAAHKNKATDAGDGMGRAIIRMVHLIYPNHTARSFYVALFKSILSEMKQRGIDPEDPMPIKLEGACEFYPSHPEDGPVCAAGSDVSGRFVCTAEYGRNCQWANQLRKYEAEQG